MNFYLLRTFRETQQKWHKTSKTMDEGSSLSSSNVVWMLPLFTDLKAFYPELSNPSWPFIRSIKTMYILSGSMTSSGRQDCISGKWTFFKSNSITIHPFVQHHIAQQHYEKWQAPNNGCVCVAFPALKSSENWSIIIYRFSSGKLKFPCRVQSCQ